MHKYTSYGPDKPVMHTSKTHIHQTEAVTTMSCSLQANLIKMFNMNELVSILASIFTIAYNFSGFLFASRGNTLLYEFTPFKRKNLLQDEQILCS